MNFPLFLMVQVNCTQRSGLAAVLVFIFVQSHLNPNLFSGDENRYKCSIEFRSPELQVDTGTNVDVLFLSQHSGKPLL